MNQTVQNPPDVFDRLLFDSIGCPAKKQQRVDQNQKKETKKWETLLASNGKLSYAAANRARSRIERSGNSKMNGIAPMSLSLPSQAFYSFPKEKVILSPKLNRGKIATRNLAKSVCYLKKTANTKSTIELSSSPKFDYFPQKPLTKEELVICRPISSTLIAMERYYL